ncbi:hypothetical protein MXB_2512, partial [Myxobolus squamalis]
MVDMSTGDEILQYTHGNHELFMFHNEIKDEKIKMNGKGLHYDIDKNILYGGNFDEYPMLTNCWKIHLPSALISSWIAVRNKGYYFIF